ncbi:MAG: hypothetical protein LBQ49_01435, partial [Rickettsiales bacterium]|nr:hypothetical protein [Rickettsiales bacterium]
FYIYFSIPPPLDPTYGRGYGDVAPAARSAIFQKLRSPYNASALVSFLESNELFKYLTENEQVAWINKHTAEELDSIW